MFCKLKTVVSLLRVIKKCKKAFVRSSPPIQTNTKFILQANWQKSKRSEEVFSFGRRDYSPTNYAWSLRVNCSWDDQRANRRDD